MDGILDILDLDGDTASDALFLTNLLKKHTAGASNVDELSASKTNFQEDDGDTQSSRGSTSSAGSDYDEVVVLSGGASSPRPEFEEERDAGEEKKKGEKKKGGLAPLDCGLEATILELDRQTDGKAAALPASANRADISAAAPPPATGSPPRPLPSSPPLPRSTSPPTPTPSRSSPLLHPASPPPHSPATPTPPAASPTTTSTTSAPPTITESKKSTPTPPPLRKPTGISASLQAKVRRRLELASLASKSKASSPLAARTAGLLHAPPPRPKSLLLMEGVNFASVEKEMAKTVGARSAVGARDGDTRLLAPASVDAAPAPTNLTLYSAEAARRPPCAATSTAVVCTVEVRRNTGQPFGLGLATSDPEGYVTVTSIDPMGAVAAAGGVGKGDVIQAIDGQSNNRTRCTLRVTVCDLYLHRICVHACVRVVV